MKKITLFYILSLILIIASIYIIIEHQDSNRMQLFAGLFITIGMSFNIVAFASKRE
jgi:hypothetical protein